MWEGKAFVRRMSIFCDAAVEAMMAASEPYVLSFALDEVAVCVMALARSFSTVRLVKYGEVNPCSPEFRGERYTRRIYSRGLTQKQSVDFGRRFRQDRQHVDHVLSS